MVPDNKHMLQYDSYMYTRSSVCTVHLRKRRFMLKRLAAQASLHHANGSSPRSLNEQNSWFPLEYIHTPIGETRLARR